MPRIYERGGVYYADCYFTIGTRHFRRERSTRIRVDGTAAAERLATKVGREIEAGLQAGENRRARGTAVRAAFNELVEAKRLAGKSDATLAITLEKSLHIRRYFEGRDIESITAQDLKDYASYATQKRKPPTVDREISELCQAMEAVGVTPPKRPELAKSVPRERWLEPEERRALLAQIMPRWREHVLVTMQLGLSKSEIFKIRPDDVDLKRNTVRVRGTKTKARLRALPMPADVRAIIERRLRAARTIGRATSLFEPWNPGNADRHLRLAAKRAKLGPVSWNDLRRTFATALAREGYSALQLRPLMGHSTTRMLDAHYARMGIGESAQHIVDALPELPAVELAREPHKRGVPAWNKGRRRGDPDSSTHDGSDPPDSES